MAIIRTRPPSDEYNVGWDTIYGARKEEPSYGFITTYTGKVIYFEKPDPASIDIIDIAHALSNQCRFAGHTKRFMSVAEHSILVSLQCPEYGLEGLLHDASEAYMVDMPTPIKRKIKDYKVYEDRLMSAIFTRFQLKYPLPQEVHDADRAQLVREAKELVTLSDWADSYEVKMPGLAPRGLRPEDAKSQFLNHFRNLMEKQHARNLARSAAAYRP